MGSPCSKAGEVIRRAMARVLRWKPNSSHYGAILRMPLCPGHALVPVTLASHSPPRIRVTA